MCQQLIEDGYSSVELISIMGEKDFPKMVKRPHRKLIREQAKREAEKAAQSQQQEISPRDVTADMEKQKSSGGVLCCAMMHQGRSAFRLRKVACVLFMRLVCVVPLSCESTTTF